MRGFSLSRWSLLWVMLLSVSLLTACSPRATPGSAARNRDTKPATNPLQLALDALPSPTPFATPTPGPAATATPAPLANPNPVQAVALTEAAHEYFLQSDLANAEASAIEAIAADPTYLPAYLRLIDVYLYLPQTWQQALQSAEAAHQLAPEDAQAMAYLAWAHYHAHQFEEALLAAERAAAIAPDLALVQQVLADVLSGVYRLEEAYAAAQRAVDLAPEQAAAWATLGAIANSLEYGDEAGDAFAQAVALEPTFFAWSIMAARHHLNQTGDLEMALALAQPAIDQQPEHPYVLAFLIDDAIERNDWPTAEANCARLFAFNQPETIYPDGYSCMASIKLLQEDYHGAEHFQTLAEAIAPPQRFDIKVLRMRLLNDDEACADSRALAEDWLSARPFSIIALRMIGVSYLCEQEYAQAVDYFQQVLAIVPRSVADARLLANAYARGAQEDEALAALQTIQPFTRENPFYYQALFEVNIYLGATAAAIEAAERWHELRPSNTEALISLAMAELFDDRLDAAQAHAQAALDAGDRSSTARAILGEAYSRSGDFEQGEAYLIQALVINQQHFLARTFLTQLYLFSEQCEQAVPHIDWLRAESAEDSATVAQYQEFLRICRERVAQATRWDDATTRYEVLALLRGLQVAPRSVEFTEEAGQRSLFVAFSSDLPAQSQSFGELERTVALALARLLPQIERQPVGLILLTASNDRPQQLFFVEISETLRWLAGELSELEFERTWLKRPAADLFYRDNRRQDIGWS